ncbi:hypothetical protein D3C77_464240 [compost metagenome]
MPSSASGSALILLGDAITLAIPEFRHPDSLHHPGDGIEAYSARCESPGHGPFDVSHLEIDPGAIMARHITLPFARAPEQPATPSRSGNSAISLPSMCTRSRSISKTPLIKADGPLQILYRDFKVDGDIHGSLFCAG